MNAHLVSLVMPAWQPRADWLRAAVDSALGQRGVELELLVVDDGSPEPVEGILADVDDVRLRVLRIPHGGAAAARNAGIAEARGSHIRFVDGDDVFEAGSTARLLALGGDPGVVTYGGTLVCDEHMRPIWPMTTTLQGEASEACLLGLFTVRPGALLFPRAVVDAAGPWDTELRVVEDWDFVLRALEHAKVRGDRTIATYYRRHSSSQTADKDVGERVARRVVEKYFERHPEQRGSRLERRARARLAATGARVALVHGRPREAVRRLSDALRTDPSAIGDELAQALPALTATTRYRLRRALERGTSR